MNNRILGNALRDLDEQAWKVIWRMVTVSSEKGTSSYTLERVLDRLHGPVPACQRGADKACHSSFEVTGRNKPDFTYIELITPRRHS